MRCHLSVSAPPPQPSLTYDLMLISITQLVD